MHTKAKQKCIQRYEKITTPVCFVDKALIRSIDGETFMDTFERLGATVHSRTLITIIALYLGKEGERYTYK